MRTDDDLVAAARQGSAEAVEELFSGYWLTAWRAAYAVSGRPDLADDAAQDAFVKAVRSLERFELGRPFAPWLARIAVNRARDLIRAEHRRERVHIPHPNSEVGEGEVAEVTDVLTAVAALHPERREVIVLHHVLGFTLAETAEALELPIGTVASRLSRAVADLRGTLEATQHA